ncbi:hypothetical protein H072_6792 [Dactylellina haptotyla CBS 200.50]|uniref:Uncharacterized protein n=1 Tax=Dactylellina haptotyla (strain CBS 200.50) TaxID=1284197 RepID=S8AE74_DACHA|nr:hypothetical protein H072_6792 [Dactylellina haptotyla CBS 200.50]
MKFSFVILATLSAAVMAAPTASPHPERDLEILQDLVKPIPIPPVKDTKEREEISYLHIKHS